MKIRDPNTNQEAIALQRHDDPPVVPDLKILKRLGRGGFGDVWLVENTAKHLLALKRVKGSSENYSFKSEKRALEKYQPIAHKHTGLLPILHVGTLPDGLYYTMPLADHIGRGKFNKNRYRAKTLSAVLKQQRQIEIPIAVKWTRAILDALNSLHSEGLIHRDIKPDNILFKHDQPIIADIGLVNVARPDGTVVGTAGYMPPNGCNNASGDLYAVGKMLYVMISGNKVDQYPDVPSLFGPEVTLFSGINRVIDHACKLCYDSATVMARDLDAVISPRQNALKPTNVVARGADALTTPNYIVNTPSKHRVSDEDIHKQINRALNIRERREAQSKLAYKLAAAARATGGKLMDGMRNGAELTTDIRDSAKEKAMAFAYKATLLRRKIKSKISSWRK